MNVNRRGRGAGSSSNVTRACANTTATRGSKNERSVISEIVHTRSAEVSSKKGTSGKIIDLKSGHFVVKKGKHFEFQQYRVDFIPNIDIAIVRKALIREHEKVLGGYLYDGDATIYLTKSLQKESMDFAGKLKDGSLVKITIKNTPSFITATDSRVMQLLNLILRRAMGGLNLQLVGRNLFDAAAAIKIKEFNMELWPGYVTSIRQHESEILVGGEIDFKVMRNETAYNILRQCFANSRFAKDAFMKEMIGMTVLTDYNNKTYRIDDVDWNSSPTSTFNTKNGSISYKDYYQRRYDIKIIDDKQPILVSKSKAKDLRAGQSELIALIPELCRVTGITDEMRKNFGIMKDLAQRTKLSPADRIIHLLDLNQRLQSNPRSKAVFEKYDVSLSDSLVEFQGRTLLPEKIKFGDKEVVMDQRSEWTHAFRKCELFTKKKLSNWFVVTPKKFDDKAKIFVNKMLEASRGMGFDMQPPLWKTFDQDRNDDYINAINEVINRDPNFVMIVVTNDRADRYAAIKKKLCIDRAIPSQVIKLRTIDPKNVQGLMSVATKVAVQMFTKIEGVPWMISIPLTGLMTVGFDTTHDSRDKSKSYGAFVATMDLKTSSRYFSAVESHSNGEEMSKNMGISMIKALHVYKSTHNALPERILIYRDGVGDGLIKHVHEVEVMDLKRKIKAAYGEAKKTPLFSFIIVSKRINSRIFTKNNMNPPVGTVVDDVITLPERYDFFLVSTGSRIGTVSPTSYNVINGCLGLVPDKLQLLTFKMCHLYYNWSGTIRVPAVVQYAHKLAFLVGQYLHQAPSNLLEKQLYFL